MKPGDNWSIPCCHTHHMEQHRIGHRAFDERYGIDSRGLAERYAESSPFITENPLRSVSGPVKA